MTNIDEKAGEGNGIELLTILHCSLIFLVVIHLFYFIFILIKQNCFKKSALQSQKPDNLRKINDSCSICLESINLEVQLLCSHSYCAECIINYGKQRYNFSDVQCPICRANSKLMFSLFERTEENKDLYDQIITYNYEVTSHYSTSFCFCLDMFWFCQYYLLQLTNFSNTRYDRHRKMIISALFVLFILVLCVLAKDTANIFEIIEDGFFYLFLIVTCAEYFYRRFRSQTNTEFEMIHSNLNTEDSNINIDVAVDQAIEPEMPIQNEVNIVNNDNNEIQNELRV